MSRPLPRALGRYEIESLVGEGGMGRVYRARDPVIGRTVAIKTLSVELDDEQLADLKGRFVREAQTAGRVSHPNVVTIFDIGESEGTAFIAMEYVEGQTLRELLDAGGPLAVDAACRIVGDLAGALEAAHRHHIVHRDVKPANVMVAPDGAVKLMDFGIARLPDGLRTKTGLMFGSPNYVSPEQIVGHAIDGRADLFSLGVVLYELLTGALPFRRAAMTEVLFGILNDRHDPPSTHNHRVPAVFERILGRALAKHPDDRYQTAAEFGGEVREWRNLPRPTAEELAGLRSAPIRTLERRGAPRA